VLASAYNVAVGMAYAGFSALVLEVIGRGAAATKYNIMASLSNVPIGYVTWIDGQPTSAGAPAMLNVEAGIGVLGLLVFARALVVRSLDGPRRLSGSTGLPSACAARPCRCCRKTTPPPGSWAMSPMQRFPQFAPGQSCRNCALTAARPRTPRAAASCSMAWR
jgi:hypothetical protein